MKAHRFSNRPGRLGLYAFLGLTIISVIVRIFFQERIVADADKPDSKLFAAFEQYSHAEQSSVYCRIGFTKQFRLDIVEFREFARFLQIEDDLRFSDKDIEVFYETTSGNVSGDLQTWEMCLWYEYSEEVDKREVFDRPTILVYKDGILVVTGFAPAR